MPAIFVCCNCDQGKKWISQSCRGCHKPMCEICAHNRKPSGSCKYCEKVSKEKVDTFQINVEGGSVRLCTGAPGYIILSTRDNADTQGPYVAIDREGSAELIGWLKLHI